MPIPRAAPWAAVVVFYTAHELAHAVFAADAGLRQPFQHPSNHSGQAHDKPGTNFTMKRHYRAIEADYTSLYASSTGVRYQGSKPNTAQVQDLIDNELACVRNWARQSLTAAGQVCKPQWP